MSDFYDSLPKSPLTPPAWAFRVVWPALYGCMLGALGLYLHARGKLEWTDPGVRWFAAQLALNLVWSPTFFWAQRPGAALAVACMLFVAIACCAWAFAQASKLAAGLLLPYLAWVGFAVYLNGHIVRHLE